jgi:tetratricopeptide (TPR) repeat protein
MLQKQVPAATLRMYCGMLVELHCEEEAMRVLGWWQERWPLDEELLLEKGRLLERRGKSGLALECYQQALQLNPEHQYLVKIKVVTSLIREGQLKQAKRSLKEYRDEFEPKVYLRLLVALLLSGRQYERAI